MMSDDVGRLYFAQGTLVSTLWGEVDGEVGLVALQVPSEVDAGRHARVGMTELVGDADDGYPGLVQQAGELFQVASAIGEDETVAVLGECGEDVRGDLPGALLISSQGPVDVRHPARAGRVGAAVVAVRSRVNVQHRDGPAGITDQKGTSPATMMRCMKRRIPSG